MRGRLAVLTLLCLPVARPADKWTRCESGHFERLAAGGKGPALEVLE
jgi:hypothetical protein